ncbi:MAG: UDP-N-acetylmuramoyl-L-alanyl-D-glutamate--2,6-diaminopimelate ligase [Patescibacteria group bacterium]|nr:UDP-N-acetylmuramoyl-L-alanyl-D-glutamate--2,6-diaminopimelate ligase [Patescibacteria group bacterium]
MKILSNLLEGVSILSSHGNVDVAVSSISINSKETKPNSLFVAQVGNSTDGHLYIDQALENGAIAIVYENEPKIFKENVTYIKVSDSHKALGYIANNFYDNPSHKLKLIGVTGTNGKTTTTTLLYQLFKNLGYKVGMIGTVVNKINDESYESVRTTPDPITLNLLLDKMVEAECEYCFMEVSSHAVSESRIEGIIFSGGVFTNLTLDHLDYHKTFENYRDAKKLFFDNLHENAFAISNLDDPNGEYMLKDTKAKKYFYSLKNNTDLPAQASFTGHLETKLIGEFNAYNVLAIYGTAIVLGLNPQEVKEEIKSLEPVAGRFQYIKSKNGIIGIVDYAHTPDALENVLKTITGMKNKNKVITVVGCGGDRDKTKRPIMAKIGYVMSDILVLTSDNPRTEDPESILDDMKKGIESLNQNKVYIIPDRREAIRKACSLSNSGDYILVAGKGHENYQEINGKKIHFDDMEELTNCFEY